MTTAQQIRDRAEAAEREFQNSKAALYRPDGSKLYSDAEHDTRVRALEKELTAALSSLSETANAERMKAEVELSENGDLSAVLSADELANANARYAFISEEVEEMTTEELLRRLSGVAAGYDRASIFAHARAARRRANREYAQRLEAAKKAGRASTYATRSQDLEQAAEMLEDKLTGGERKRKMADAKRRVDEYFGAEVSLGARKYNQKQRVARSARSL